MNNILTKPYTNQEYADFAVYANETQRHVEDFNGDKYALLSYEILQDGEVVDIRDTEEYQAEQLEEEKVKKLAEADTKQSEYLAIPFMITLRGYQFPCVATDKVVNENLPQAIKDAELTGTTVFYDPSNPQYGFDDLTLEEINSVALAISERRKPTYIKKRALKFAIKSVTTLAQLEAITINYTGD